MARWMRALPGLERRERRASSLASASTVQPGRLAQGPDEKLGLAGFTAGAVRGIAAILSDPPRSMRLSLGRGVLRREIRPAPGAVNGAYAALHQSRISAAAIHSARKDNTDNGRQS